MATGSSIPQPRGPATSDITPAVSMPSVGDDWDRMAASFDRLNERVFKPGLMRRAEERGREEGLEIAEGTREHRPLMAFGEIAEARERAAREAYQARVRTDIDDRELAVSREHAGDPAAYREAMRAVRLGFVQGAPAEWAVDVDEYIDSRTASRSDQISERVSRVQMAEAEADLTGRTGRVQDDMIDMLMNGQGDSPAYQALQAEQNRLYRERLDNPLIAYSDAEADLDAFAARGIAATYVHDARTLLRTEGAEQALALVGGVLRDDRLSETQRPLAFESAREAVLQEVDIAQNIQNIQVRERELAETEIGRRIDADVGTVELTGEGTDLSADEVSAVLGPAGVAEWYRRRADAFENNRLTGDLATLGPDEAMERIQTARATTGGAGLGALSGPIDSADDLNALVAAISFVETGGRPAQVSADPDGAGPAGGGAVGLMQILPDTARAMAARLGVAYDASRLLNDPDYNRRLGTEYLRTLMDRYDGSVLLATTAYHAGPGNVDQWLANHGDPRTGEITPPAWLDRINAAGNPRSARYPRLVAEALGAGRSSAAWEDLTNEQVITNARDGFSSDPLQFARQHNVAALVPLTLAAPIDGNDAQRGQWAEALRGRYAQGGQLAERYEVPQRILTNGEATFYRDRIERDPGAIIPLARATSQALGGRGARDFLAEIGQGSNAGTAIHIADLAATGGDARFADQAAHGLTLQAAGQTIDPDLRDGIRASISPWRTAFRDSPTLLGAIENAALSAALADHASGQTRDVSYYAQAAMGRTRWQGREYGGAARVNDNVIIVPRWMNPSYFDDALEALGEQWNSSDAPNRPTYVSGEEIPPEQLRRLRPSVQADGRYRLVDEQGRVARTATGAVFELNLERARAFLSQRLGVNAVRPD